MRVRSMSMSESMSQVFGHARVQSRVRVRSHDSAHVHVRVRVRSRLGDGHKIFRDFGHGHDFGHEYVRKPRTRTYFGHACPLISALNIVRGPSRSPKIYKMSRNSPKPIDFTIHRIVRHSIIKSIRAKYLHQE